jgi:hypothetical protein
VNRIDHLLTIAAEECAEIAQRISKAQRFGLREVQPGQDDNNAKRIMLEVSDLLAVLDMVDEETLGALNFEDDVDKLRAAKRAKVERFLEHSAKMGRLDP